MSEFTKTAENRCFEDYEPGATYEFGSIPVDARDIIAFGRQFDPQVFHIDPEGAKNTMYGGLIASGWHTGSLMMRLFVENYLPGPASLGSPGVDELSWLKPVRPGDELTVAGYRDRSPPIRHQAGSGHHLLLYRSS